MRIGILTGGIGAVVDLHSLIQEVVQAEEDGFDSFWMPQVSAGPGFDALTVLSLAGARTSRIALGTGVVPIFPIHPMTLAKQALTANLASNNRLTLGLGLSHRPSVEDVFGLSYDAPARHMSEYLSVIRPLINESSVEFAGKFYNVKGQFQVAGATSVPVLIAALAPRMLRIAGEQADGTITWMTGVKTIASHVVPRINAAAQAINTSAPRVCVGMPIAVTNDPQAARDQAAKLYQRYGQLTSYRRMLDLEGVEGPSEVAVIGSEAEVEQQLRGYADAGATEFLASIFPVGDDEVGSISRTTDLLKSLVGKIGS